MTKHNVGLEDEYKRRVKCSIDKWTNTTPTNSSRYACEVKWWNGGGGGVWATTAVMDVQNGVVMDDGGWGCVKGRSLGGARVKQNWG